MSDENERLLADLARRVEARERAGDYDLPWLDDSVEEVDPPTPVDRLPSDPAPSLRAVRGARCGGRPAHSERRGTADMRCARRSRWLKLALDAEGASREEAQPSPAGAARRARGEGGVSRLERSPARAGQLVRRADPPPRGRPALDGTRDLLRAAPPATSAARTGPLPGSRRPSAASTPRTARTASSRGCSPSIGVTDRRFVEIGIGDGRECNTAAPGDGVRLAGADGRRLARGVAAARAFYARRPGDARDRSGPASGRSPRGNVDALLAEEGFEGELDLLSIDIDGNDLWVWEAIERPRPRVVVIEYNGTFGPDRVGERPLRPGLRPPRAPSRAAGTTARRSRALDRLARRKGYVLAGCDSNGVNAFFVRADCAARARRAGRARGRMAAGPRARPAQRRRAVRRHRPPAARGGAVTAAPGRRGGQRVRADARPARRRLRPGAPPGPAPAPVGSRRRSSPRRGTRPAPARSSRCERWPTRARQPPGWSHYSIWSDGLARHPGGAAGRRRSSTTT